MSNNGIPPVTVGFSKEKLTLNDKIDYTEVHNRGEKFASCYFSSQDVGPCNQLLYILVFSPLVMCRLVDEKQWAVCRRMV